MPNTDQYDREAPRKPFRRPENWRFRQPVTREGVITELPDPTAPPTPGEYAYLSPAEVAFSWAGMVNAAHERKLAEDLKASGDDVRAMMAARGLQTVDPQSMARVEAMPSMQAPQEQREWMRNYAQFYPADHRPGMPTTPGMPYHPIEYEFGHWASAQDAAEKATGQKFHPQFFQGKSHAEAARIIAGSLMARRMRQLGANDPSVTIGPSF